MLSMKQTYKFKTFLESNVLCELTKYFKNIDQVQDVESICTHNCTWIDYFSSPHNLAKDPIYSKGHAISYLDDVSNQRFYFRFHNENVKYCTIIFTTI